MKTINKLINFKYQLRYFFAIGLMAISFQSGAQNTLRISAIPDESPTELQRKFKPLGDYLSKETGLKV